MKNPSPEEDKIIRDIKNIFGLKKEQNDTAIKDIRNIFRLEIIVVFRNIKSLFEWEKEGENYYKPVWFNNFWINNYIEYKCNGDKNKIENSQIFRICLVVKFWKIKKNA